MNILSTGCVNVSSVNDVNKGGVHIDEVCYTLDKSILVKFVMYCQLIQ